MSMLQSSITRRLMCASRVSKPSFIPRYFIPRVSIHKSGIRFSGRTQGLAAFEAKMWVDFTKSHERNAVKLFTGESTDRV